MLKERKRGLSLILAIMMLFAAFVCSSGTAAYAEEVKAEENLQSKSLRYFVETNKGLHGIRYSMAPYREQSWMTNCPLYAVEAMMPWTER